MRKVLAGISLLIAGTASAANPPLLDRAERERPAALALLERLVNIDSGTFNAKGLDDVGALAAAELRKQGFRIATLPAAPAASRNIVATRTGTGKGRVLLVAHMDTVFADGTAAKRPFRIDGNRERIGQS